MDMVKLVICIRFVKVNKRKMFFIVEAGSFFGGIVMYISFVVFLFINWGRKCNYLLF